MARKEIRLSAIVVEEPLSSEELIESKGALADEEALLYQLDEERTEVMRDFANRRKVILDRRAPKLVEVSSGKKEVRVDVREEYDPDDDLIHVVRIDNDEEVETREPRSDERTQHDLNPKKD